MRMDTVPPSITKFLQAIQSANLLQVDQSCGPRKSPCCLQHLQCNCKEGRCRLEWESGKDRHSWSPVRESRLSKMPVESRIPATLEISSGS